MSENPENGYKFFGISQTLNFSEFQA